MDSKDTFHSFSIRWDNSIENIIESDWRSIFGSSNIKSYRFFQATEYSNFNDVEYYYLSLFYKVKNIAIIPCFTYYLDLIDLLTGKMTKSIINKLRRVFSDFGKYKLLVIGSYPATCEHFIGIDSSLDSEIITEASTLINKELESKRKELACSLIMVKDVRTKHLGFISNILSRHFYFFSSFPTTFFPLLPTFPYPAALNKRKQKRRYLKYSKLFDEFYCWEKVTDFKEYTPLFYELYQKVLSKAKNKFEVLNENFFLNLNTYFPDETFLLIARDRSHKVKLIQVLMKERDRLLPLYLGTDKEMDDEKSLVLYLNAIFKPIKYAESIGGLDLVEFGQTSYYPKVLSGALVEDLSYGFYSHNRLMELIIKYFFKYIFIPEKIPAHAYSNERIDAIKKFIEEKGMVAINI